MSQVIILNPIPDKDIAHLIDAYPQPPDEFIISSMKERSLLATLRDGNYKVHVMHPNLMVPSSTVILNRVGGKTSFGRGTIQVRDIKDYLEKVTECPEEIIDDSGNPSIRWSCQELGIQYTGRDAWDIPFSNPYIFTDSSMYIRALLPYNYGELWDIVGTDVVQYILISLIINDMEYWTKGIPNRELYLRDSPFETKVYMFLDGKAPKSFNDRFMYWMRAVKDFIPVDYVLNAQVIMGNVAKLLRKEVRDDLTLINEYDSLVIKDEKFYYSNMFNYL